MQAIWYGALGALLVLGSAALGFFMGRWGKSSPQPVQTQEKQKIEEHQRLQEQQRAFEGMLCYNAEVAYGMTDSLPAREEEL